MRITSPKVLAELARARREELKLSLRDCAAWCGVGTRFLFDLENAKPSVHFDKVLSVVARLGISIEATQRSAIMPKPPTWASVEASKVSTVPAPGFDGADWLTSRGIGFLAASKCNLPVLEQTFDRENDRLSIEVFGETELLIDARGKQPLREEQGGPGFREIFEAIDSKSISPLRDVRLTLRWALFTYLVADVTVSAFDLRLSVVDGCLAPFGVIACASGEVAADRVYRGLRIGREWPEDWLRVDHWTDFAYAAGVKPKIVLDLMAEMAVAVPSAVKEAAIAYSKSPVLRGAAATIVSIVNARATRMKDLMLSAEHQGVPGLRKSSERPTTTS
jgi:HTH-type transcriptional regulator/antitoxin HipB